MNFCIDTAEAILLLGGSGLLGRHVRAEFLRRGWHCVVPSHAELDICRAEEGERMLASRKFSAVVNCAAFCSFSGCEADPERSLRTNKEAPIAWARACAERGLHFVQFSSDYIFDGREQRPYLENDAPHPLNVYGQHKAQVEAELIQCPGALVLRVAWLFGCGGRTFLSLLPGLLREESEVRVASGKRGACLHVGFAARVIADLCARRVTGLFNLVHRGETSWELFARRCLEVLVERGLSPRCQQIMEVPFTELPHGQGARPAYSVLEPGALEGVLADEWPQGFPSWEQGLRSYLGELWPLTAPEP